MKLLIALLLIYLYATVCISQRMTDRELQGLKGKVKILEDWNQKVALDGKPTENPRAESETTFDEAGHIIKITLFDGGFSTTYSWSDDVRISQTHEHIDDPRVSMKFPDHKDKKYKPDKEKYKYDKDGRITWTGSDSSPRTASTYVYDKAGRVSSSTLSSFNGGLVTKREIKYDSDGNEIEVKSTTTTLMISGAQNDSYKFRFSNYKFDKVGNWIQRTATEVGKKDKDLSASIQVRYISYY